MNRTIHKHISLSLIFLLLLCWHAPQLQAQEPNVRLKADSTFIGLGDPIVLTLAVSHKQGADLSFPNFRDTMAGFEVLDVSSIYVSQEQEIWEQSQKITLIRFDTGSFKIPEQTLMYQESGTSAPTQIKSNPLMIDVVGIEVDTTQAYKPIKGIASVGISWDEIWPWALIGIVVLGILGYFIYRFTRKKEIIIPEVVRPAIPPHEIAMKKLAGLEAEKLWQKGELKEYYVELTGIIREYIEGLFSVPALESITDEIIRDLEKTDIAPRQLKKLTPFLQMADLAKFAKFRPTEKENLENMEVAREFVKETKKHYSVEKPKVEEIDNTDETESEVSPIKDIQKPESEKPESEVEVEV